MRTSVPLFVLPVLLLLAPACGRDQDVDARAASQATSSKTSPSAGASTAAVSASSTSAAGVHPGSPTDCFPNKVNLKYARLFSVEYHDNYKVVTVDEPIPSAAAEQYVLLQRGTARPEVSSDLASAPVIEVPILSMFSGSTTHLPLLADLGHLDILTGVLSAAYPSNPTVRARLTAGEIVEYAPNSEINVELVVSRAPSVLMSSGDDSAAYETLRNAGVRVVANAEWLESTALGRAEWIKYMSLFLNEEARATTVFDRIEADYKKLAARTRVIPEAERPKVMTGQVFNGTFYATGGRSYVAELIHDAGGHNVWRDNEDSGSLKIDLETQLNSAADADIWINGSGSWTSLASMVQEEPRYAEFKAFAKGQVWLQNKILNATGGNEYWERGVTRPDLVLADLVKIFHPELVPDHEFEWYRQLQAQ